MTVRQTDGRPSEGLAEDCQVTGCGPAETMRCMREEHGSWRVTWERCEAAGAWGRERGTRACARYMSPLPDNAACDARARSSPVRACSRGRGPMRESESRESDKVQLRYVECVVSSCRCPIDVFFRLFNKGAFAFRSPYTVPLGARRALRSLYRLRTGIVCENMQGLGAKLRKLAAKRKYARRSEVR